MSIGSFFRSAARKTLEYVCDAAIYALTRPVEVVTPTAPPVDRHVSNGIGHNPFPIPPVVGALHFPGMSPERVLSYSMTLAHLQSITPHNPLGDRPYRYIWDTAGIIPVQGAGIHTHR